MPLFSSSRNIVIGVEKEAALSDLSEYGFSSSRTEAFIRRAIGDNRSFNLKFGSNSYWGPVSHSSHDVSLPNVQRLTLRGDRWYYDYNGHPEFAMAEALTAGDAVTCFERNVLDMRRLLPTGPDFQGDQRLSLYLNNNDEEGRVTFAEHENYWVSPGTWGRITSGKSILPLFLVLRPIFAGNGRICTDGTFELSERAGFIEKLTSINTISERGLINTRDIPHGAEDAGRRLHLISGDSNILVIARYFKLLSTQLVLRGIEDRIFTDLEREISYHPKAHAIQDLKRNSKEFGGWSLTGVRKYSGVEILGMIFERVKSAYSSELSPKDLRGLNVLLGVLSKLGKLPKIENPNLDSIAAATAGLEGYLCWALKFHALSEFNQAMKLKTGVDLAPNEMISQALSMHDVREEYCTFSDRYRFRAAEMLGVATRLAVCGGFENPNRGTRSQARGALLRHALRTGAQISANWVTASVAGMKDGKLDMPHPDRTYCGTEKDNGDSFIARAIRYMNGRIDGSRHNERKVYGKVGGKQGKRNFE